MPTFTITAPDGRSFTVNAPEGTTREEAMARVKAQYSAQDHQPPPEPDPPPERTREEKRETLSDTGIRIPFTDTFIPGSEKVNQALIGAGRFATEVGQGAKQKAMMLGEDLGILDEGDAQGYTDEIMQEKREWDENTEGAGIEDIGYYGAMLAPAVLAPGAGVAGTAALGGLEAGIMPTEEASWSDTAKQTAIGAGTAGVARYIPDAVTAFRGSRRAKKLDSIDPDAAALAEKGVKMSPDMYNPSLGKSVAREIVDVPIVSDKLRGAPMRADAERVMREMAGNERYQGGIQDAFVKGKGKLKEANSQMWNRTMSEIGDAPVSNANLGMDFARLQRELTDDASFSSDTVKAISELWADRPKRWMSVEDLHNFRKRFGNQAQRKFAEEGLDSVAPKRVYELLTREMERGIKHTHGKPGMAKFQAAVDADKNLRRKLKNTRVLKAAGADALDSESTFVKAALGQDKDKRQAMKYVLGEQGAPAVRREIANDILDVYMNKGAKAGKNRINALNDTIEDFFGPDEAAVYRGLGKFLDNMPSTGVDALTSTGVTGAVQGGLTALTGGPGIPAITQGALAIALRRRDVQAMLQKLSTAPKDSKLAQELSKYIGLALAGNSAEAEPLRVPIQDGIPQ